MQTTRLSLPSWEGLDLLFELRVHLQLALTAAAEGVAACPRPLGRLTDEP